MNGVTTLRNPYRTMAYTALACCHLDLGCRTILVSESERKPETCTDHIDSTLKAAGRGRKAAASVMASQPVVPARDSSREFGGLDANSSSMKSHERSRETRAEYVVSGAVRKVVSWRSRVATRANNATPESQFRHEHLKCYSEVAHDQPG